MTTFMFMELCGSCKEEWGNEEVMVGNVTRNRGRKGT